MTRRWPAARSIIAPNLFMEHAENIIAARRCCGAQYRSGRFWRGPRGQVDCGLGKSMAAGSVAITSTDLIIATGDRRPSWARFRVPDGATPSPCGDAFFIPR
jgi:alkyl sulfatase BDS1-like metallo-beta-lactamase superfamily hydrolase